MRSLIKMSELRLSGIVLAVTGAVFPCALVVGPISANAQVGSAASAGGRQSSDDPFADYFRMTAAQQIQQQAAAAQVGVSPGSGASTVGQPVTISNGDGGSGDARPAATGPANASVRAGVPVPPRAPDEFESYASDVVGKSLRRFGTTLLVPESRDYTVPPLTSIPDDYRLNPGDSLAIGMTGAVNASNLTVTLNAQGRIFIPRIGAVDLGGVRYRDARSVIAGQVARFYRNVDVTVAVARLHGITVYVTGFAAVPGSYTVSSLSTLVNAVLAAGGPAPGGSFRSIQVKRAGKLIADFDLYDLLLKGNKSGDVTLQNGDVIYIAPVGAQVAVIGSVNNEAIFEAGPTDTLHDVLVYAGGINTVADNSRLLVLDPLQAIGSGWQEITAGAAAGQPVKRGQIVRVLSGVGIAHPVGEQPVLVTISGEVANPGRYYFQPGVTIDQVLAKAGGLTPGAFPYATVFTRQSVRLQQQLSYQRAIEDAQTALTARPLVSPSSTKTLSPTEQVTVVDALMRQLQARKPDGRVVLDIDPAARMLPSGLVMENNDTLYIPPQPAVVGVFGAVPNPATFRYQPRRALRDYLDRTGGAQRIADKSEIFVVRANGSVVSARRGALKQQALPGDLMFVPINARRGEFMDRLNAIFQLVTATALPVATIYSLTK